MGIVRKLTWSSLILGATTTTDTVECIRPDHVRRILRMNNLVHAVKKACPKSHHRHVHLKHEKPMLEEVPSPTSCKNGPDTMTCCSLAAMKKLLSALRLPWGHLWYDEPESRKEDSAAPSA